jgi:hypothetical protein
MKTKILPYLIKKKYTLLAQLNPVHITFPLYKDFL